MKIKLLLWLNYFSVTQTFENNHCTVITDPICPNPLINYFLYTRKNVHYPQLVTTDNITESYYEKSLPNKFILHGFNSDLKLDVLQRIKSEYLKKKDVNVWMIDYTDVSNGPFQCYLTAVYNLPTVGKCAALFVSKVMELSKVGDQDDLMHVIGFSLGGQLAGMIAEHLKPMQLPRITGLDPALPLFYSAHLSKVLSRNDAKFVDVIHTNAMIQGQLALCGDIDFYVNGGFSQPGCNNSSEPINCDHLMAPTYFAESIGSENGFWGWHCLSGYDYFMGKCPPKGDHQLMGEWVNQSSRGRYILYTNSVPPFAQGKFW